MTGRSVTAVVFGVLLGLVGFVLILGGLAPLTEPRDADGFYMGDPFTFEGPSRAIVTSDIGILRWRYDRAGESSVLMFALTNRVDIRMQGVAAGPNVLFMGIAATADVDAFLDGVAHDEIADLVFNAEADQIRDVQYTTHEATATPSLPGTETFWVASVAGTGLQTLDWPVESGEWTAVIMNADASRGVTAELALGARVPNIDPIAWATLTVGLIALIGGGLLMYLVFRRLNRDSGSLPADPPEKRPTTTS